MRKKKFGRKLKEKTNQYGSKMKKVKPRDRIVQKTIGLYYRQIQFFDEYPEFDVNKLVREKLDEQIKLIDETYLENEN